MWFEWNNENLQAVEQTYNTDTFSGVGDLSGCPGHGVEWCHIKLACQQNCNCSLI